ncbi:MAG: cytochrome c biogenesis protein ResB [Planctomycetes bacterium]|nr:cytochrome c biogenesis protein ResB [Planctomycetota bacterium]
MTENPTSPTPPPPAAQAASWGWRSALLGILGFLLLGEGIASVARRLASGSAGVGVWGSAVVFLVSAGVFLGLHGPRLFAFFRSVRVGALTIALYAASSCLGVLVKQRDLYSPERAEDFYAKFAYAQTYFVYHLLRPFPFMMPRVEIPPRAEEGIEWRRERYGKGLAEAQRKSMLASLSSMEKEKEVAAWQEHYDPLLRKFFAFCEASDLTRVWKSDWFAALNALLFACVLSNAFRFGWRAWFTKRRFGFFVAHTGVVLLLLGCLLGRTLEKRGRVDLSTDPAHMRYPTESKWFRPFKDPTKPLEMPFTLRLEEFKAEYRTYLQAHFLDPEARRHAAVKPPEFLVRKGAEFPLDYDEHGDPRVRIRVKEVLPRCEVRPDPIPGGGPDASPVIAYEFEEHLPEGSEPHHHPGLHWILFPGHDDSIFSHPDHAYRIRAALVPDAAAMARVLGETVEETPGRLLVEVGEGEEAVREEGDARVGASLVARAAGDEPGEITARVLTYVPAFRFDRIERDPDTGRIRTEEDPEPIERRIPNNPALEVEIKSGETSEIRWVFANFDIDEIAGSQHRARWKIPGVRLRFRWDRWRSPVAARYVLLFREDGALFVGKAGEPDSVRQVRIGEPLSLGGEGSFTVTEAHRSVARLAADLRPLPAGEFFHRDAQAAVLEIEGPAGKETVSLAALPGFDEFVYDGRIGIRFLEGGAMPREWRSRLGCYDEKGERIDGGEIRVNDYLEVKGYRFFQENASAQDTTYSGIGVVFDPGIPLVLLGLYTIIAGAVYAFFVKPVLLRRGGAA